MEVQTFIDNYREAFGPAAELPLVFGYSNQPWSEPQKVNGCFFKCFTEVRSGIPRTLDAGTIGCGGGKLYTGFSGMPERVPHFVSLKEKYKQTPEMVIAYIEQLDMPLAGKPYLNFCRVDQTDTFDDKEGILFFASPDILSGLTTWAYFDNNDEMAVSSIFGSGCSAVVSQAVTENRRQGRRTFIGGFDPSVRPYLCANELTFTIPIHRFREMYNTMRASCLYDTHAWKKICERIDNNAANEI